MTTRHPRRADVVAIGCACVALSAAAQTQQRASLYDRYTEPIQIFKNGLGTFSRPISSRNTEAQAFFDQGFQMMYSFAKSEKAYGGELKDHPRNGWSLLGLQRALEGKGVRSPEVDADLAASWVRADNWIRSSRF
jgi:hypothetical protein